MYRVCGSFPYNMHVTSLIPLTVVRISWLTVLGIDIPPAIAVTFSPAWRAGNYSLLSHNAWANNAYYLIMHTKSGFPCWCPPKYALYLISDNALEICQNLAGYALWDWPNIVICTMFRITFVAITWSLCWIGTTMRFPPISSQIEVQVAPRKDIRVTYAWALHTHRVMWRIWWCIISRNAYEKWATDLMRYEIVDCTYVVVIRSIESTYYVCASYSIFRFCLSMSMSM